MQRKIGKAIAAARKAKGLTQTELGVKAGLAQNTVSNMESGKVKNGVRAADAIRVSKALEEPGLLVSFCQACPVRPYLYPEGSQADPAAILERMKNEMQEAADVAADLTQKLTEPGFRESQEFKAGIAKVRSITRGLEALEDGLSLAACGGCR